MVGIQGRALPAASLPLPGVTPRESAQSFMEREMANLSARVRRDIREDLARFLLEVVGLVKEREVADASEVQSSVSPQKGRATERRLQRHLTPTALDAGLLARPPCKWTPPGQELAPSDDLKHRPPLEWDLGSQEGAPASQTRCRALAASLRSPARQEEEKLPLGTPKSSKSTPASSNSSMAPSRSSRLRDVCWPSVAHSHDRFMGRSALEGADVDPSFGGVLPGTVDSPPVAAQPQSCQSPPRKEQSEPPPQRAPSKRLRRRFRRPPSICPEEASIPKSPRKSLFMTIPPHQAPADLLCVEPESSRVGRSRPEPCAALRSCTQRLVEHELFDYAVAVAIVLNAALMGAQTHYAAAAAFSDDGAEEPQSLRVASTVFCIAFTVELLLRLAIYRRAFFVGEGWRWNVFDLTLVCLQLVEEGVAFEAEGGGDVGSSQSRSSLGAMRILRVMRLLRVVRVVRVLRLVRELRTMVRSIANTVVSLLWTLLLLLLVIYVVGICFTQMVADSAQDGSGSLVAGAKVHDFYGSLDRTLLALYQTITGGINWKEVLDPLVERTSPGMALPFVMYIAFAMLAMLNVITGVFVESAMVHARKENNEDLVERLSEAVEGMKVPGSGHLTWENFERQLYSKQMQDYLSSVDLDPSEAEALFRLLDSDSNGTVDAEDFIMACLRLHGAAKAIDLTTLMCEVRWLRRRWHEHAAFVEERLLSVAPPATPSLGATAPSPLLPVPPSSAAALT